MNAINKDKSIIRELAKSVAEIAAMPVQEEKRRLWRSLNGLRPERPMVMIDQICWNELNYDGSLDLRCEDTECRSYEQILRRILYRWKHFPVDMVVEPFIPVPKAIRNIGYGLEIQENVRINDPNSDVLSHKYINILDSEEDIEKIMIPEVSHDTAETARRLELANDLFGDILEAHPTGADHMMQLWDPLATYMGPGNAVEALAERPEFIHKVVAKMMASLTSMIDQLEDKGLLCDARSQTLIHCTGAYTDELPKPGYDPEKPRCKDLWTAGLAQMFSMVSPEMHQEFELDYMKPMFERYGLVYYGCCEPLDYKLDVLKKIPNVRKISMSPWTKAQRGAEGLGRDFVFSSKPNPAFLAYDAFNDTSVRNYLTEIKRACDMFSCPLEFIMKDISTIRYDHVRLSRWADIAMEVVTG